ncbi:SCAN domain-containing protein 3-like [Schistocerca piceifrons]|uniref:SCAN domain-containing protein 3-like n=1 Tax=Schistocerca piceifrons TaxID=274613 RepID=UPI001F5F7FE9|nr:SCAN domain-containing protein 3-like [Schistocerca piceifrons]
MILHKSPYDKAVLDVSKIHCVIHYQHLVGTNVSDCLQNSLQTVITAVNKIKSQTLNGRLFQMIYDEKDEHFEYKFGGCFRRFYDLFDTLVQFLVRNNSLPSEELKAVRHDVGYLSNLLAKFNENNVQLQDEKGRIHAHDLQVYCDHLSVIHEDMTKLFNALLLMEILNLKEIPGQYLAVWKAIKKLYISFPTSYLVECGFSVATQLLSKQRNRLQIAKFADIRLLLTEFKPYSGKLISLRQCKNHYSLIKLDPLVNLK